MINNYNKFLNESVYKDEFLRLYNLAPIGLKKEIETSKTIEQSKDWHSEGVVYIHIRLVTNRLENTYHDKNLTLAGFFHDLGKNYATEFDEHKQKWTAKGHEDKSVEIVEEYKDWIIEQGGDVDIISYIVENHMKYKYLDEIRMQEQIRFMSEPYFPYVEKFATADIGGTDLNCTSIDDHKEIKNKIVEFYKKEEENKIISAKFNAKMIMDKYPKLRGEKLGNALSNFKKNYEDFKEFVLDNSTEYIMKAFDDYMIGVTESVRDMMKPKSEKEIEENLSKSSDEQIYNLYNELPTTLKM